MLAATAAADGSSAPHCVQNLPKAAPFGGLAPHWRQETAASASLLACSLADFAAAAARSIMLMGFAGAGAVAPVAPVPHAVQNAVPSKRAPHSAQKDISCQNKPRLVRRFVFAQAQLSAAVSSLLGVLGAWRAWDLVNRTSLPWLQHPPGAHHVIRQRLPHELTSQQCADAGPRRESQQATRRRRDSGRGTAPERGQALASLTRKGESLTLQDVRNAFDDDVGHAGARAAAWRSSKFALP